MQDHTKFALEQLDRQMGFYSRNDGKAALFFSLDLAVLGLLAVNFPYKDPSSPAGILGAICAALLLTSLWRLYSVFFPHLRGPAGPKSLLYFMDVADTPIAAYRDALRNVPDDALFADAACQIHRNAEILRLKFRRVEIAAWLTFAGAAVWLIFLGVEAGQGIAIQWKL